MVTLICIGKVADLLTSKANIVVRRQLGLWADYLQERMKKMTFTSVGLLDHDDERVKCVLGLMAYRKLVQLKENL